MDHFYHANMTAGVRKAKNLFVFAVRTNPEPSQVIVMTLGQGAITATDAHCPVAPLLLELERRVERVVFEECILLERLILNLASKRFKHSQSVCWLRNERIH